VEAIADAAVRGLGLAYLPLWVMHRHVQSGALELLEDGPAAPGNDVHAVWPATRHLPSKTRAAIDALVEELPAVMGEVGATAPGQGAVGRPEPLG
jgi:DNA-binding transcriptional LysR family regulator